MLRWTDQQHDAWKARRAKQCADIDQLEREVDALGDQFAAVSAPPLVARQATLLDLRTMQFDLPMPPSCNSLYGVANNGAKYLLPEQREFRTRVIGIVHQDMRRAGHQKNPLVGRIAIECHYFFANLRRTDIRNRNKALDDALVHAGAIRDDSLIDEGHDYRIIRPGEEGVRVVLREIAA